MHAPTVQQCKHTSTPKQQSAVAASKCLACNNSLTAATRPNNTLLHYTRALLCSMLTELKPQLHCYCSCCAALQLLKLPLAVCCSDACMNACVRLRVRALHTLTCLSITSCSSLKTRPVAHCSCLDCFTSLHSDRTRNGKGAECRELVVEGSGTSTMLKRQ
eukprot:16052-Heterococcus_DN1.PRE.5